MHTHTHTHIHIHTHTYTYAHTHTNTHKHTHTHTGGDDERVLVWKVREVMRGKCHPAIMDGRHQSNVFSVIFNCNNSSIFSGGELHSHCSTLGKKACMLP